MLSFLKQKLKLSNKEIKLLLDKGLCKRNKTIERFSSVKLQANDEITFQSNYKKYLKKEQLQLSINVT